MSSLLSQFLWRFLCGEHLDGAGRAGSVIPCSGLRRGRNRIGVTRFLAAALKSGGRLDCGILRSMADRRRRLPENVAGDFFVDDTCIDCDACRAIAPATFHDHGAQSSVYRQPENPEARRQALKALVTCPTASIGTESEADDVSAAVAAYPERIDENVYFCGFTSEESFGGWSYLIVRPPERGGNVLVDSPRFTQPLVRRIRELGGIRQMFLSHKDDVADHAAFAREFGCTRIMHAADGAARLGVELVVNGTAPVSVDADLVVI